MKRLYLSAALAALFVSPAYGQTDDFSCATDDCPLGAPSPFPIPASEQEQLVCNETLGVTENCATLIPPTRRIQDTYEFVGNVPTSTNIVVVGSRIEYKNKTNLTSPVSILNDSEIKVRGNAYISDLLRTIPGASINRSGPAGSITQLRLRGSEGNHVLVLVDGVEVSNPNTGEFDFASLRSEDVVRIEVLRGEQSALWGSAAIGGVVNIITRAGETNESYTISVEAGSFNTLEGQVSAVIPVRGAALSINGNAFSTDGYDVSGLGGEEDGAKSRAINIGLNNVELGSVTLSAKYSGSHATSEFDSYFRGRLINTDAELETNTDTGRVSARFDLGGFDHLINFGLTDTKQFTTGTNFQNDKVGKRTQVNWAAEKSWDAHNLTVLAETEKESFSTFGGVGAAHNQTNSIQNHALAADYRYNQNAITLTASMRVDFNDRFDDSQTWRVGAGYGFEDFGGRVRASIGTGVKNPSFIELFGFNPDDFIGNPALMPETSLGYSIGYDQDVGVFNISIDYFRSDLENEIYTIFGDFDFATFTRLTPDTVGNRTTKSKREGVELEARGSFGDSIDVRASATFLDAKENGVREVRRPDFLASATATWAPTDALSFTLSAYHTGSQIDTDFATFSRVELPAFTLVGLNAQWAVSDIVTLSVRGDNLLDEDYQEVVGYQSQGRGVYAGFSADF